MSKSGSVLPIPCNLPDPQRAQLLDLWRDGFVRIRGLLSEHDAATLRSECARMMRERPEVPWSESASYGRQYRVPKFADRNWSVLGNIAGLSAVADQILERLFTHPELAAALQAVLGTGYKICQLGIRRSEGTDEGLRMHQDAGGEFGMSVLLGDIQDGGGTTAFLPGTHRYPLKSSEAGMPYIHARYLRPIARSATGQTGDVILFFNKTWHGRLPATRATQHDAILLSFFGAGYEYLPPELPPAQLQSLPPELARLLDPGSGLTRLDSGRCVVSGRDRQPARLVDEVYRTPATLLHPAQMLRLLVPVFKTAFPLVRRLRRRARTSAS